MAESRELLIDPFVDDNVDEPRRVDYSVPGFNEGVADRVITEMERLQSQPRPRYQTRAPKTLFIASRQPGFGKSHLIGKLFRALNGKATLVYLRPFEDPDICWKSILIRIVQELDFPDRFPQGPSDEHPPSQLELFAHGVLSQIVADHIESEDKGDSRIPMLRQPPEKLADLITSKISFKLWKALSKKAFSDDKWIARAEHQLRGHGLSLRTSISTWLKVLYGYTYLDDDWGLARACLDWIQGDPIDDEEAKRIGVRLADRPRGDMTAGELNELAKGRIQDLCRLAGFFRPFLFCFDQTETYGKSPELARCLGRVIIDLTNECHNQLTLMTANIDPWAKKIEPHWEQAGRNRLIFPFLTLDTLTLKQGVALAGQRLSQYEQGEPEQRRFWGDRVWLEALFRDQREMGVRLFLNKCSTRWQQVIFNRGDGFRPPLEGLFHRYQDQISTQERRLVFDRDAFYWLVYELAVGLEGLEVDMTPTKRVGKAPRWRHGKRTFIFYLDPSSFWRHWEEIADTVLKEDAASKPVFVCPRTPELEPIPKPSWKAVGPKVQAATASRLCLLALGRQEMVRLYAAQDLYSDAVQGDIAWSPEEVAHFLRRELAEFWRSILDWRGEKIEPKTGPVSPGTPSNDQQAPVVEGVAAGTGNGKQKVPQPDLSQRIIETFAAFKLEVRVTGKVEAPQLVRYAVQPGPGVKVVSLANRADDLQVNLALPTPPRIEAAKGCVTIDVPKEKPDAVLWRDIRNDPALVNHPSRVAFPVGLGVDGKLILCDFADSNTCHALVAGTSGSGKSEFLKSLVASLMVRNDPSTLRLSLIDPKILTFGEIEGAPHLTGPIITHISEAIPCLEGAADEMDQRYQQFKQEGFNNLGQRFQAGMTDIPFHVILFDEFADLILAGKEEKKAFENLVARLAAKGRASGIHLVLATQRPDSTIVTGPIKANLPLKVCLRVTNATNSKIILDEPGGEALVGRGDLLCDRGKGGVERGQSPFLPPGELARLVRGLDPSQA